MFEMGFFVALGLLVTLAKVPWRTKLWMTSHVLFMDVLILSLLSILHWGTFSGMMVATIGALVCSLTLSLARRVIGFVSNGTYIRGFMDVSSKL